MKTPTHPQQGAFNIDKARAEAEAANERRRHEHMIEKQATRLALMSRHDPQAKAALIEFVNSQGEAR